MKRLTSPIALMLAAVMLCASLNGAVFAVETPSVAISTSYNKKSGVYAMSIKLASLENVARFDLVMSFDNTVITPCSPNGGTLEISSGSHSNQCFKPIANSVAAYAWDVHGGRSAYMTSLVSSAGTPGLNGAETLAFYFKLNPGKTESDLYNGAFRIETASGDKDFLSAWYPPLDRFGMTVVTRGDSFGAKTHVYTKDVALSSFTYPNSDAQRLGSLKISAPFDGDTVRVEKAVKTYPLTLTAFDTGGAPMSSVSGTRWSISAPQNPKGVTISSEFGVLTVTNAAQSGSITIKATNGAVTATKNITVRRAASVAAGFNVYRLLNGKSTLVKSAGAYGDDFTDAFSRSSFSTATAVTYTARIIDQFGAEISNAYLAVRANGGNFNQSCVITAGPLSPLGDTVIDIQDCAASPTLKSALTLTIADLTVDWSGIAANSRLVYGTKNSALLTLPPSGTGSFDGRRCCGKFSVKDGETVPNAGTTSVTAVFTVDNIAENGEYAGKTFEKAFSADILKAEYPLDTITFSDARFTYDGAAHSLFAAYNDSDLIVSYSDNSATNVADSRTVTASFALTADALKNYSLSDKNSVFTAKLAILPRKLDSLTAPSAISVFADSLINIRSGSGLAAQYGKLLPSLTGSYSGGSASAHVSWSLAPSTPFDASNYRSGTYRLVGTLADSNFSYGGSVTGELIVLPCVLAAVTDGAHQKNVSISASAAHRATDLKAFGLPDALSISYRRGIGGAPVTAKLPSADWDASLTALKRMNADDSMDVTLNAPPWLTIPPEKTIKTTINVVDRFPINVTIGNMSASYTYGEAIAPSATADIIPDSPGAYETSLTYAGRDGTPYAAAAQAPKNVGSYTLTAKMTSSTHRGSASFDFAIKPKALAVTIDDKAKTYGDENPTLTHSAIAGLAYGETESALNISLSCPATRDTDASLNSNHAAHPLSYVISGAHDNPNYTVTFSAGTLTINQKPISGTLVLAEPHNNTLIAMASDYLPDFYVWTWHRGDTAFVIPDANAMPNAHVITAEDSGCPVYVTASAKPGGNFSGTLSSNTIRVQKSALSGPVSLKHTDSDGDGTINAGDKLDVLCPHTENIAYKWMIDGITSANDGKSTFVIADNMSDKSIRAIVSATSSSAYVGSLTSAAVTVGTKPLTGTLTTELSDNTINFGKHSSLTASDNGKCDFFMYRNGARVLGATLPYTVTNDDKGATLIFAAVGKSAYSGSIMSGEINIPAGAPSAPTITFAAQPQTLSVSWTPAKPNGAPILGYKLYLAQKASALPKVRAQSSASRRTAYAASAPKLVAVLDADASSYTISGLPDASNVSVSVFAVNSVGSTLGVAATAPPPIPGTPELPSMPPSTPDSQTSPDMNYDKGSGIVTINVGNTYTLSGNDYAAAAALMKANGARGLAFAAKGTSATINVSKSLLGMVSDDGYLLQTVIPSMTNTFGNSTVSELADGYSGVAFVASSADEEYSVGVLADGKAVTDMKNSIRLVIRGKNRTPIPANAIIMAGRFKTSGSKAREISPPPIEVVAKSAVIDGALYAILDGSATLTFGHASLPYDDIDDSPAKTDVAFVSARSLIVGTSKSSFSPDVKTSRAMLSAILYRLEGSPETSYKQLFLDVPLNAWYSGSVTWAARSGIIVGIGNSRFSPEAVLTREQLVTILHRYAENGGFSGGKIASLDSFHDRRSVSPWALASMRWAVGNGLVSGDGRRLAPQGEVTRAEIATMMSRLIRLMVQS